MEQDLFIHAFAVASGGILSFGSILIVLVLLGSKDGTRKAIAYVSGTCIGYFLIGLAWFILSGFGQASETAGAEAGPGYATWAQLGFGILLLAMGIRTCLKKPPSEEAEKAAKATGPLAKIDGMQPRSLFRFGAIVSVINVKNQAIFLSALSIVDETTLGFGAKVGGLVAIIAVLCSSVITPIILALLFAKRATAWLAAIRRRIEDNMRGLSMFVMFLFGSVFSGLALASLLGLR